MGYSSLYNYIVRIGNWNFIVNIKITKIDIMIIVDKAPVLPNSKVVASALGISATIPEKMISDIPLPIPL